jgi:hypothetical protein
LSSGCLFLAQSGNNQLTGCIDLSANRALSVRANKLHTTEATAAKPSVTERYQRQTKTQSGGGRLGIKQSVMIFGCC